MKSQSSAIQAECIRPIKMIDLNTPALKIGSGDLLQSAWGRYLSPAPTINCTTNRSAIGTIRRMDTWLILEAVAEARLRKDSINQAVFGRMSPSNLSPSDRDGINLYIFNNIDGAHAASFVSKPKGGAL